MIVNFAASDLLVPAEGKKEMISLSQEGNRTKVKINSSSLSVIQDCPRKALYSLKQGWRAENESPATLFGSAIHKALEIFYSGSFEERELPKLEDLEAMSYGNPPPKEDLLHGAVSAFLTKAQPLSPLPPEDKRSLQSGVWILWNYFKAYLEDPYVAFIDEAGPFVERPFSFTLYENEEFMIEYFGTIDLVVRHIKTGDILVCDHKTSSIVGNDFYNRIKPNHQYTGYLLGAQIAFGLKTSSFLVNCIGVKARPKTARGTAPDFPRQVTQRTEEDFQEFREVILEAVMNYLRWNRTGRWPLGPTNVCANYGGCSFLQVCSAPSSLRENILKSKFTTKGN